MRRYDLLGEIEQNIPGLTKIIKQNIIETKTEEKISITNLQSEVTKSIEKASQSVVSIVISKDLKVYYEDPLNFFGGFVGEKKEKIGGGSGIIVSSDGYILTNKHVVQDPNADYTVVTRDGNNYKVDKIWMDPVLDIAILKIVDTNGEIPGELVAASLTTIKNQINIGDFVIAIGNALSEFENSSTFGIISGIGRQLKENANDSMYIGLYQTDAPINPGNSGGPLVNINGEVIGVNTAITSIGQGIGFAIPVNKEFILKTLEIINQYQKIERPFVGIIYIDLDKNIAKNQKIDKYTGLLVQDVLKGSPASLADIRKGDIILQINGEDINKKSSFIYKIYTYKPGDNIELLIYRNKDYQKVTLKLDKIN